MKLDTSSHILWYYPPTKYDGPYFKLVERARQNERTPEKLLPDHELTVLPNESSFDVLLNSQPIGQVSPADDEEVKALADFTSQWRHGLSGLDRTTSDSGLSEARIAAQVYDSRNEFIETRTLKIRIITWNMHGEPIISQNLASLLGLPIFSDIYVLALQESDTLGPRNLYANHTTLENTKVAVLGALNSSSTKYVACACNQLLGLLVIIFVPVQLETMISGVELSTTGTGLLGVWGNKGAASIRFDFSADPSIGILGTKFSILNCHLAAGEGQPGVEKRRWELAEIQSRLNISGLCGRMPRRPQLVFDSSGDFFELSSESLTDFDETDNYSDIDKDPLTAVSTRSSSIVSDNVAIDELKEPSVEHESLNDTLQEDDLSEQTITFVAGDLNYRVALDPDIVTDLNDRQDYDMILVHDQLNQEIKEKSVFTTFLEGDIHFAPTYKYKLGSQTFDGNRNANGNKARAPSYTDRIFYRAVSGLNLVNYTSHMEYTISDHKPVTAAFELTLPMIDGEKRAAVVARILKHHDALENAERPHVQISPKEVSIVDATVLRPAQAEVTLSHDPNGAQRSLNWKVLINNPDIKYSPTHGTLPVGAVQQICFECTPQINIPVIEDVAIVQMEDGQDYFIPIEFKVLPTCLGASLDVLSRMPKGARSRQMMDSQSTNMPKEIWNCVDYLWTRIVPDMFEKPGEASIEFQILDWMDCGQDFDLQVLDSANQVVPNAAVYSVASQLILLLKYLDGGIVPAENYPSVLQDGNLILELIPRVNVNVLLYLTSFMRTAIDNGVDSNFLYDLFEPLLISIPPKAKNKAGRRRFLESLVGDRD